MKIAQKNINSDKFSQLLQLTNRLVGCNNRHNKYKIIFFGVFCHLLQLTNRAVAYNNRQNKNRKTFFVYFFISYFLINSNLAFSIQQDTTRFRTLLLEVSSSKISSDISLKYNPNSIIEYKDIVKFNAIQVNEAIQFAPGVYIKDYGGLAGMKTISMRNTSSAQNVVMINGMKLSSTQNSISDLSNIPISLFSAIEVVRGGNSAVFGGGSIGGAINFIAGNQSKSSEIMFNYGSFDEYQLRLKSGFEFNDTKFLSNIEFTNSEGNYPFKSVQFGKEQTFSRTNGHYQNISLANSIDSKLGKWDYFGMLFLRSGSKGLPGAVIQGKIQNDSASLSDKEIWWFNNFNRKLTSFAEFKISLMGKLNYSMYEDPQTFRNIELLKRNTFLNREVQLQSKIVVQDTANYLDLNLDAYFSNLKGDMLNQKMNGYAERYGIALSSKYEKIYIKSKMIDASGLISFRTDFISELSPAFSSMLASIFELKFLKTNASIQVSNNFRPPNFNEMYYLNYGNENLRPEKSVNINFGLKKIFFNLINTEINAFFLNTTDQIIAVAMPGAWSAQNVQKVITQGIELGLNLHTENNLIDFSFNYTLQEAIDKSPDSYTFNKEIIYSPKELINSSLFINFSEFSIGSSVLYSSFRYALPANDLWSVLPDYLILNSNLTIKLKFAETKINLRADVLNILDEQYSVIINYPMPGRSFRFSINLNL